MFFSLCTRFLNHLKNLYGHFWNRSDGLKEYYLKLDGYYFCQKKRLLFVILKVRYKRTVDIIEIQDLLTYKNYINELHPIDAYIIGILAHLDIHNLANEKHLPIYNAHFKEHSCFIRSEALLQIYKRYKDSKGDGITVLRSRHTKKELKIPTNELCNNSDLIYTLDPWQAISLGYEASESTIKHNVL